MVEGSSGRGVTGRLWPLAAAGALCAAQYAQAQQAMPVPATVREAYELFITLHTAGDERIAELYADNAKVRTRTLYADGQVRYADVRGVDWKQMLRTSAALGGSARSGPEPSSFGQATESAEGPFVVVAMPRYGKRTCFRDEGYFQVYGQRNDGRWLIVQEQITTIPVSYCQGMRPGATKQ